MLQPVQKCRFVPLQWIRSGLKLVLLTLFLCSACWAQNAGDTTSTPVPGAGHNYLGILNETVNPANGSLSVRISTPVPPGRKLTVPFSLAYDSNGTIVLEPTATGLLWGGTSTGGVQTGWRYTVPTLTYATVKVPNVPGGLVTCEVAYNYVYQDASGGRHPLYLSIWGNTGGKIDCSGALMPDGTPVANPQVSNGGDSLVQGYTPAIPADGTFTMQKVWVADADGTVVSFSPVQSQTMVVPDSIEDRNGNVVTVNHPSPPTGFNSYTDTLGRTSVSVSGGTTQTVSVSGVSNYTAGYQSESATGLPLTIDQYSGSCPVRGGGTGGSSTEITILTMPNSEDYQFFYDSASGNISKIIYPTGGYVRYVWGVNSKSEAGEDSGANGTTTFSCAYEYDTPVVTDRYVSFNGSTEVLHQQFSYTTTWNSDQFQYNQKTTTVTTYDLVRGGNFQTKYTYSGSTVEAQPSTSENITNQIPVESQIQYYDWAANGGSLLKTVNKTFQFQNENEMTCESTTLGSMTSRIDYTYLSAQQPNLYTQPMALVTDKKEWDWGTAPPCTSSSSGTPLRETVTNYNSFTTPIYAGNASIWDKPSQVTVYGSGTQIAQTTYGYTETVSSASVTVGRDSNYNANSSIARGNASSMTRWRNTGGSSPVTTYAYDDTGQATSMIDPCGNPNSTCADMAGSNHTTFYAYSNDNAYLATITYPNTGVAHTENFTYNNSTGEVASSTDENGKITSYSYSDPFARLTKTVYPDTGQTTLAYNDTAPTPSVTTSKEMSSGQFLTTVSVMDGVGHVTDSELTSDPVQADQTATVYDGSGNPYTVTNPYRTTSDPTYGLTTYTYDSLGRTTVVKHPDSSTIQTKYTGAATQVTDEGNGTRRIQRISQSDGLGRLTSVCEVTSVTQLGTTPTPAACNQNIAGTGFLTSYTYDALDDLLSVSQGGLSARTFVYNSLSELTSATNPESGLTTYTYDANGNMASRTQPEENQTSASDTVTTNYAYDALNRMTAKQYSDETDNVDYNYDETSPWGFTLTNQIGKLTTEYDGNTGSVFSYDPMGRVLQNHQCTPQNCGSADFPIAYTYDGIGDIVTSTDGQVNTYTRTYNDAAQLTSLVSSYSDANHPPTLFSTPTSPAYNAPGMLVSGKLGNGITETFVYNPRLEMTSETAGSVYSLSLGYAPNGDVSSAVDKVNGSWTYTYDDFNRLATASGPSQPYTYAYDRFGNRWNQELSGSCTSGSSICLTFDANNHINNGVETYDAAGNLMTDGFHNYFYDAEHHLVQVDGTEGWCQSDTGTAATACYTYDAEGRRVRRAVPGDGITDDYLYDLSGHFITQVSGQGSWVRGEIYAGGQHIATYENDLATPTTFFTHADQLGTERVQTAVNGSSCETITNLPFGDGMNETGSCDPTQLRFTGKQRDFETDLDNFGARYNSSSLARFMSPDPLAGHTEDPQTLNKYSYVRNSPLNLMDPTGLDFNLTCSGPDTATCQGGVQGTTTTTTDANGNQTSTFTATVISNDENGNLVDQNNNQYNATVSGAGVSFSQVGSTQSSMGVFINGSDPTSVQGSGDLAGFDFTFTYSNMGSGVNAGGTFTYGGTAAQAETALENAGFGRYSLDAFDPFHLSTNEYQTAEFRTAGAKGTGAGSGHVTVDEPRLLTDSSGMLASIPLATVPTTGTLHLGEHNPYTGGFWAHFGEALRNMF